jgi:hypothetical protein
MAGQKRTNMKGPGECVRCGTRHYLNFPCAERPPEPPPAVPEAPVQPVRITRRPGSAPDGLSPRRGDELKTVVRYPGNRFYRS